MSATFLNNNKILLCLGNHLSIFKPPLYESPPLCQLNDGPFMFATAFNGLIAAVAQNDAAGPPRTQFFLLLYHEKSSSNLMKSIEFPTKILGLKSTSIHLFVSMSKTIQVFDLRSFRSISALEETSSNGLFAVNQQYIAWPDDSKSGRIFLATVFDFKVKFKINCHNSEIKCFTFTNESNTTHYLITSSRKGTLIRLFDCTNGQLVTEFRRGFTQGSIVAMDMKNSILCVCTTTTVHVFIKSNPQQDFVSDKASEHSSSVLSTVLAIVQSSLKSSENNENGSLSEGQSMHLTATPSGVPLACSVNDHKNIYVVMNNGYLFKYELSDDYKNLVMKNVVPLKIVQ